MCAIVTGVQTCALPIGREHALAWKLAQSSRVDEVLVAPGNAGTATEGKCRNADVAATDIDGLLALARDEGVALTVVGPEGPLVAGIVDRFRAEGLRLFGHRKSVVSGKRVSVRLDLGGRRVIKKKNQK